MGNPEFTRNVWLEMTPHRVIAMPLVIGAILFFVQLASRSAGAVSKTALYLFLLIALLWGTRQAAGAVAREVRDATWDAQRVSALGAWPMSWGKLFGSTLFQWYGGLICVAVIVVLPSDNLSPPAQLGNALRLILAALAGQALALAASLALLRKAPDGHQLSVNLCHALGVLAGFLLIRPYDLGGLLSSVVSSGVYGRSATWYGYGVETRGFKIFFVAVFLGWSLVAVYRSMRIALQHRTLPWGWAAFSIFIMVFADGYLYDGLTRNGADFWAWLVVPAVTAATVVYLAYLTEEKNVVTLAAYVGSGRPVSPGRIVADAPSWLVCLAIATIITVIFGVVSSGAPSLGSVASRAFGMDGSSNLTAFMVALLLFVYRDIGFLLHLNLNPNRRRADAVGLFYLFLLYVVGTGTAKALGLGSAMHFFAPVPIGHPVLIIGPVLWEVLGVIALLSWRLRSNNPPLRTAGG